MPGVGLGNHLGDQIIQGSLKGTHLGGDQTMQFHGHFEGFSPE